MSNKAKVAWDSNVLIDAINKAPMWWPEIRPVYRDALVGGPPRRRHDFAKPTRHAAVELLAQAWAVLEDDHTPESRHRAATLARKALTMLEPEGASP